MARLKVFRTPIGFYDAYVAAPSRAAALRAWGADSDLFAAGAAELVTDAQLSKRPLGEPGVVIKISRGSAGDHLNELERTARPGRKARAGAGRPGKPAAAKPRPSRAKLDSAEARLEAASREHQAARARIDRRLERLRSERDALDDAYRTQREALERTMEDIDRDYQAALAEWRATD